MSSTDHIPGRNQTPAIYHQVLITRALAFIDWWNKRYEGDQDEADWDEDYREWMDQVEQVLPSVWSRDDD